MRGATAAHDTRTPARFKCHEDGRLAGRPLGREEEEEERKGIEKARPGLGREEVRVSAFAPAHTLKTSQEST